MQTFVPYDNCLGSARCLDVKRLGKQRVETLQILNVLTGKTKGWKNHPAVKMWEGHEVALCIYGDTICAVWIDRGFEDSIREKIAEIRNSLLLQGKRVDFPNWWGKEIHASHRSNLLRKDPAWYSQFGWEESPDLPYFWPVK